MLMPVPPGRDSRATSSLRIDQQPATTSALVTKRVKPANINCRETGLRSLVTNNCGHPRTKSEVSPKITFYGRLHVIAYRATPDVPREVAWFLAKLLAAERQRRGTPRGSRALTCFWQAVLGLRWFGDRTAADALARDHGISRATACRYLDEVVIVLAEQAPDLREALEAAGNLTSIPAPATPSSVPCAASGNEGPRCSPAGGAPFTTSPPAPAKSATPPPVFCLITMSWSSRRANHFSSTSPCSWRRYGQGRLGKAAKMSRGRSSGSRLLVPARFQSSGTVTVHSGISWYRLVVVGACLSQVGGGGSRRAGSTQTVSGRPRWPT